MAASGFCVSPTPPAPLQNKKRKQIPENALVTTKKGRMHFLEMFVRISESLEDINVVFLQSKV